MINKYGIMLLVIFMLSACGGKDGIDGKNGIDGINSNSGTNGIDNGSANAAAPSNDWKDHDFHYSRLASRMIVGSLIEGNTTSSISESRYYDEHNNLKRYCKTKSSMTTLANGYFFQNFNMSGSDSDCTQAPIQLNCKEGYRPNDSLDNCVPN